MGNIVNSLEIIFSDKLNEPLLLLIDTDFVQNLYNKHIVICYYSTRSFIEEITVSFNLQRCEAREISKFGRQ